MIRMTQRGRGVARGLLLMAGVGGPWPGMGQDATPRQDATPEVVTVTDRDAVLRFVGPRGRDGRAGHQGSSGLSGFLGSSSAGRPRPGGRGKPGGRGENGEPGQAGGPGPEVAVWMDREPEGRRWLRLRVEVAGKTTRCALDPEQGALAIQSVGGAGGYGGKGGDGGRGGHGGLGHPSGSSGPTGPKGFDATSGATGRGGPIRVTVTPEAKPFLDRLHLSSPGGPEPVILEGPWPFAD